MLTNEQALEMFKCARSSVSDCEMKLKASRQALRSARQMLVTMGIKEPPEDCDKPQEPEKAPPPSPLKDKPQAR